MKNTTAVWSETVPGKKDFFPMNANLGQFYTFNGNKCTHGNKMNITLFHYRNHGSATGRVLCGIQVPEKKSKQFQEFLNKLGYLNYRETNNMAYQMFLKNTS